MSASAPERSNIPHAGPEARHPDDMDWMVQRFPGQTCKMVFHPTPERPSEPNAGLVRYAPGAWHPVHSHEFAQVWYILEGEFNYGGRMYGPGTMIFHRDPHTEPELRTSTGGTIVYVQYMGPTTRQAPIYDGRFNLKERRAVENERTDI